MESLQWTPNSEIPIRALENIFISNINVPQCTGAVHLLLLLLFEYRLSMPQLSIFQILGYGCLFFILPLVFLSIPNFSASHCLIFTIFNRSFSPSSTSFPDLCLAVPHHIASSVTLFHFSNLSLTCLFTVNGLPHSAFFFIECKLLFERPFHHKIEGIFHKRPFFMVSHQGNPGSNRWDYWTLLWDNI